MRALILLIFLLLLACVSCAGRQELVLEDLETRSFFRRWEGCAVISGPKGVEVYNPARAETAFSPCSTFKIPHALIALESGAVEDADRMFFWDGQVRSRMAENRHHTFKSAMRESIPWVFQEVALLIGRDTMEDWLGRFDYGNRDLSGGLTEFWLGSSLKISAREQVEFLSQLQARKLPMRTSTQSQVLELMRDGTFENVALRGKSGTARASGDAPALGWYVGTVEAPGGVTTFAVNISGADANGSEARHIALFLLKRGGHLPLEFR